MLNILIPMSGPNQFETDEYQYPKPLIEISGRPLIEHVVRCLDSIRRDTRFIFVVNKADCDTYHLDSVLRLIARDKAICIQIEKHTSGAVSTALMAIEHIDNDEPLMVSNSDHVIEADLDAILDDFEAREIDAGTVCFDSVHPKWSYVRLDGNNKIVETAEKRPLSRHAIAGLYYFRRGADFVRAAMRSIEKDASVNGLFYVAPVFNELILENKNLEITSVPTSRYHNFYSPHKIKEYESYLASLNKTVLHGEA